MPEHPEGVRRGSSEKDMRALFAGTQMQKPQLAQSLDDVKISDPSFIQNLRFGDGALLRDGTGDHPSGRTLKGRYIVRVGWDDVRGWFAEACALCYLSVACCLRTNRVVRSSGPRALKRSEHPRAALTPLTIWSRRASTR
jgi:6-phosphofructokinase 1